MVMPSSTDLRVEVLGVYRLPVTDELVREQIAISYAPGADAEAARHEAETRALLGSVVLVELLIRNRDARYDARDFTQAFDDRPRGNWPAAYMETYLTLDGESIIETKWPTPPPGDLRVAFYLQNWDPVKPLRTSYGAVRCPAATQLPERLAQLMPFEPFD
jgi:hypothetical protein